MLPPALTATTSTNSPAMRAAQWQPGQRLEAVVLERGADGQQARIRVGDVQLDVRLPVATPVGARVVMQVIQGGAQPVLQHLSQSPVAGTAAESRALLPTNLAASGQGAVAPRWLTQILPMQGSQATMLSSLVALQQNALPLPPAVRQAIDALQQQIPNVQTITQPKGLERAVWQSGLFHEANLARHAAGPVQSVQARSLHNLKSALLALATRLRADSAPRLPLLQTGNTPTRLSGQAAAYLANQPASRTPTAQQPATPVQSAAQGRGIAELPPPSANALPQPQKSVTVARPAVGGPNPNAPNQPQNLQAFLQELRVGTERALARLVLHQWGSSKTATEVQEVSPLRWLFELPVSTLQGFDIIHFLFERSARDSEDEEAAWHIRLALDLPELGPVHARITLKGQAVTTRFWVEDAKTLERLRVALPDLQHALETRQLSVQTLSAAAGQPPDQPPDKPGTPLISERA